jgi:hypothetical protein
MPRLRGDDKLTGPQTLAFRDALQDAFDVQRFSEMIVFYLERDVQDLSLKTTRPAIFLDAILKADRESWSAEFLQAARTADPANPALLTFAQQFQLAPTDKRVATTRQLERTIREANGLLDPDTWRRRMGERERQIGRIMYRAGGEVLFGTGFLLGPDVVMTNYHVIEPAIRGQAKPEKIELRFDYKILGDEVLNQGVIYRLAVDNWCIDTSQYSLVDLEVDPGDKVPAKGELDYALLRVDGTPGSDPVGGPETQDPSAPTRGFIEAPTDDHKFALDSAVFILQHPDGAPLKLALETQSVISVNSNDTRVRHRTNTEGGSSGSPCFDANWNLIALHHIGDPNYEPFHKPQYNQAIPFAAIRTLLETHDKLDQLGTT